MLLNSSKCVNYWYSQRFYLTLWHRDLGSLLLVLCSCIAIVGILRQLRVRLKNQAVMGNTKMFRQTGPEVSSLRKKEQLLG